MSALELMVEQRRWIVLGVLGTFQAFFLLAGLLTRLRTGERVRGRNPEARRAIVLFASTLAVALAALFVPEAARYSLTLLHANPALVAIGLLLLAAGGTVGIGSSLQMGRSWRVGIVEGQRTPLVDSGIFRWIRNPYFLSYLVIFAGLLCIVPGVVLAILTSMSAAAIHRMVLAEERFLLELHGEDYRRYRERTWRYFPPF